MLQVVTFNIGGARKMRGPKFLDTLAQDVHRTLSGAIDPDQPAAIAVQEVGDYRIRQPELGNRTMFVHVIEQLADAFGSARSAYVAEVDSNWYFHPRVWERDAYKNMESAAEGNGILTTMAGAPWDWGTPGPDYPGSRGGWCMSSQISRATLYSTGSRDTQPRNVMVASLMHPTYGPLFFMNTHLGTLTGEDRHNPDHPRSIAGETIRVQQAKEILMVVAELRAAEKDYEQPPRPLILTGDFNAVPGSAPMNALETVFTLLPVDNPAEEQFTHTSHQILIDHVLVSDPRGVLPPGKARIVTDAPFDDLTDHLPVVATFA